MTTYYQFRIWIQLSALGLLLSVATSPAFAKVNDDPTPEPRSRFVDCELLVAGRPVDVPVTKVDWSAWAPFLPAINHEYKTRRDQHFSIRKTYPQITPVGRAFYEQPWVIDGGSLMYKRYLAGEQNVVILLSFGWRIDRTDPSQPRLVPPDTYESYLNGYYKGIHKMYSSRGIYPHELPVPALPFVRIHLTGDSQKDFHFARPGIDAVPDPSVWRMMMAYEDNSIDVPADTFQEILALNSPPMNPIMFDHDSAHVTDNLVNPDYYLANQIFYARTAGSHSTLSKLLITTDPDGDANKFGLYARSGIMHEELALPNLRQRGKIEILISHLLQNPSLAEVSTLSAYYSRINDKDLVDRASRLSAALPEIVIRHGGGMGDPYNLYNDLNIRTTPSLRLKGYLSAATGFVRFFKSQGREMFSQAAVESLPGMGHDLEFMAQLLNGDLAKWSALNMPGVDNAMLGKKVRDLLIDRLARLEVALYWGVQMRLTAGQFVRETTEQCIDPSSASYNYMRSFSIPGSLYEQVYLSRSVVCR